MNVHSVKEYLEQRGIEIFRMREGEHELHIAERIRLHLMDANVRVHLTPTPLVRFVVRGQKSDFPDHESADIFAKIRAQLAPHIRPVPGELHPWREEKADQVDVRDPSNPGTLLDVWCEVSFVRDATSMDEVVDSVRLDAV